jgi:hypothetical protein
MWELCESYTWTHKFNDDFENWIGERKTEEKINHFSKLK